MERVRELGENAEEALTLEDEVLALLELDDCLDALNILQEAFLAFINPSELQVAEGRRCILGLSDLQYHQRHYYFEVTGARIILVNRYEHYNTLIMAPLRSVLRVLQGTLEGDEEAFSKEWARGKAKVVGEKNLHDAIMFADVFKRLARLVKRYRQLLAANT